MAVVLLCLCAAAAPARGQTTAAEVNQAAGVSSESIAAVGTQLRLLGEPKPGFRFEIEGAWGSRSKDEETDVFGTAYPYDGSVEVIEAFGEYFFTEVRGFVRSRPDAIARRSGSRPQAIMRMSGSCARR